MSALDLRIPIDDCSQLRGLALTTSLRAANLVVYYQV